MRMVMLHALDELQRKSPPPRGAPDRARCAGGGFFCVRKHGTRSRVAHRLYGRCPLTGPNAKAPPPATRYEAGCRGGRIS